MRRRLTRTLLASLAAAPAWAAESDDPQVYVIDPIVVEAPRAVTTLGGASAIEADVDSLPLPAAPTVEDVLRELPFLHVRTNSRGEAELSARGSESRQVAVLVDGVPITLSWDARADVSVIPATSLRDVTFTRGLSSMLTGPNVLGGVIEVGVGRLREQPTERTMEVTVGADDVGTFGTTVTASLPFASGEARWLVRGGVGFRDTPGDPLARHVTEPLTMNDDLRLNTDSRNVDGFVSARVLAGGGAWVAFSGSSFTSERGIAAELGVPDEDARLWRYPHVSRTLAVLSAGTGIHASPFGGKGDVEASIGLDRGRTDIDAYTSRAYDEIAEFENARDRSVTLRVLADQTLGRRGDLRGAFTWSGIHHDEIVPDGTFGYEQNLMSAGLESSWRLVRGHGVVDLVSVSVGGAYDRAETPTAGGRETQAPLSELGGRAGVTAVLGEGRTVLHAGVSRRGRFPALRELYSGALNRFVPNPDLEPEKLLTTEAGATLRAGDGVFQAVVFHNLLEDAVVRTTLEDGRFQRVNRNELETTGLELMATYRLGPVDATASATFQSVDLRDPDAGTTNRPENLPEAYGDVSVGFPIALGLRGRGRVEMIGEQFVIDGLTGENARLAPQAVAGVSVSREWAMATSWGGGTFSRVETRVTVENIGDVAQYDAWGLPEPGRRVRVEMRVR